MVNWDQRAQTGTASHVILIGIKSSNNVRWLNILIKIGTNEFWWAPRLQPDFINRLESEYKQGKAYRYFSSELVKKAYINELRKETSVYICDPCLSVVQKNKSNEAGGYIHSAYSTCTARILGTCNHVTGMLFRIENNVLTDLTTPTKRKPPVYVEYSYKGQKTAATGKPVWDLVSETSVYTKPQSKSVKLSNDKKRTNV